MLNYIHIRIPPINHCFRFSLSWGLSVYVCSSLISLLLPPIHQISYFKGSVHSHDVLQRLSHEVMIKNNAIVARSFGRSAGINPRIWLVSRDLMLGSERSDI